MALPRRLLGLSIVDLVVIVLLGVASGYVLAVVDVLRLVPHGDLGRPLALGATLGWPPLAFAWLWVPYASLAVVLGALAGRGPRATLAGHPLTSVHRVVLANAPLLAALWVLTQDDTARRAPLVAVALAAAVGVTAYLATGARPDEPCAPAPSPSPHPRPSLLARARPHAGVLLAMALHAVVFSYLAVRRDAALWSATVDLGIFKEALWHTLHGRLLYSPTVGYSFLGEHFSPVLLLLVPLYALAPTSATLLIVQTCAVSLAAWPIYRLALVNGLGRRLATFLAASMIFAPAMHRSLLYDFHMDLLGVPALAWALLAAHEKRYRALAVAAVFLCSVKEEAFVSLTGVALAMFFAERGTRRAAVVLGAASVAYCALAILLLARVWGPPPGVPIYMGGAPGSYKFMRNFQHLQGPGGPLRALAVMPLRFVLWALTDGRFTTACVLFAPVLFAPLFAGRRIFVLAPLGILLLSDNSEIVEMQYHYGAMQHPGAYAAGIYGMAAWLGRVAPADRRALRRALAAGVALASGVVVATHAGSALSPVNLHDPPHVTDHVRAVDALVARVPAAATVSSSSFGGPRFSNHPEVWLFPHGLEHATVALVDLQRPAWPSNPQDRDDAIVRLLRAPDWGVVAWASGAILLARGVVPTHIRDAARELFLHRTYEVEGTEWTDYPGAVEADPRASDGYARVVRPTDRRPGQWVVFGPYIRLPRGRFRVTFRLRGDPTHFPGTIGGLDVFSEGQILASHALTAEDLPDAAWHDVSLEFDTGGRWHLEFRVSTGHAWVLGADKISLTPLDDEAEMLQSLGL